MLASLCDDGLSSAAAAAAFVDDVDVVVVLLASFVGVVTFSMLPT